MNIETVELDEFAPIYDRAATIIISRTMLRHLLNLPENTQIECFNYDPSVGAYIIQISHPNLKKLKDGDEIPRILPSHKVTSISSIEWPDLNE